MREQLREHLEARTKVERRDPRVGKTLGRFRVEFRIASGGFGAIYYATDTRTRAKVALKILHSTLARDQRVVERFRREAVALTQLRDPHTLRAYQLREADDGTLYIVMELLRGESLHHRLQTQGPLPWRRAVHIARGICSSLTEAHAVGIVHRDLKPANIHLERRGDDPDFVKVVDFGIAKILHGAEIEHTEITTIGQMLGTVEYMSPEQMVGGELSVRSDIYSLGVVLYEMVTGRTPFAGAPSATAIVTSALTQDPEPPSRYATVPRLFDHVVARCLEPDARHRFTDIAMLADALAELSVTDQPRPQTAPPMTSVRAQPVDPNGGWIPGGARASTGSPVRSSSVAEQALAEHEVDASGAPILRLFCMVLLLAAAVLALATSHRWLGVSPDDSEPHPLAMELMRVA